MQKASEREEDALKYVDMRDFGDRHTNAIISALHFQHKLFLRETNEKLLPSEISLDDIHTVIDLICGSGSWCLDFSKQHPNKRILGLDYNHQLIEHAWQNTQHASPGMLNFQEMKRVGKLPLDDETCDLIHLQSGTTCFSLTEWPGIMAEAYRLLKPGGWLNLVDFEMGPTSQPALDRVLAFLGQILSALDRSSAPIKALPTSGCTMGPQRLTKQGFINVGYHLYPVNLGGWNNPIGRAYLHSIIVRPEMITRLAVEMNLATEEELRPLLREMQREMQQIGFCACGMLLSSFGQKSPDTPYIDKVHII